MPDDETINQMLARGEEEFEIYQVLSSLSLCVFVWGGGGGGGG